MAVMVGERLVLSGQRLGLDPNLAVPGSSPALQLVGFVLGCL